jgi:hypothetical protein
LNPRPCEERSSAPAGAGIGFGDGRAFLRRDLVQHAEHLLGIAEAVVRRLRHRAVEEQLPVLQMRRQARDRVLRVHQCQAERVRARVGQAAGQQLVGEHAHAVQVGAAIDGFAARLLGRHVAAAADRQPGGGDAAAVGIALEGDAEVGEQRPVGVVEQHVLGLDVAVHDAARVRVLERGQQRAQHLDDAALVVGEVALAEVAAGEVGQHVIEQALRRAPDLVDADDARVLELGDRVRLLLEARLALLVGEGLGRHHLDRHLPVQRHLHAQVHIGHAALANAADHPITGDLRHVAAEQGRQFFRRELFRLHRPRTAGSGRSA